MLGSPVSRGVFFVSDDAVSISDQSGSDVVAEHTPLQRTLLSIAPHPLKLPGLQWILKM
jgi:serine kinase of HPr protein (carbohydrate metabolism regulator)